MTNDKLKITNGCTPSACYYNSIAKRFLHLTFVICSFVILALASGCGQSGGGETTTTTTATTSTTSASQGNIIITGTLQTGTFGSSGAKALATAVANYTVVAIDNATDKTYYATSDASGNFSLTIPSNVSYEVSLINDELNYFGPIVMAGNTSSSEVAVGLHPVGTAQTNLGGIIVDASHKAAEPTIEPIALVNFNDLAKAASGLPKGAGNYGKTEQTGITTRSAGADIDKDGIPNLFDADENNDGIRNGILSNPSTAALTNSNTIEAVFLTSNIWYQHGSTAAAKDSILMRLHVQAKTGRINDIQSVKCLDVPSTIKDVAIVWDASSLGSPESYPTQGTVWKNVNYSLYKTTTGTPVEYTVLLIPKAIMNTGDTFRVRATYTGGSYEDFFITTSYVMTDWARITTYESTTLTAESGTRTNPVIISGNSLQITFSKPRDEDNNILQGLTYSVSYGTTEAQNGTYGIPSANVSAETVTDSSPASLTLTHTITVSPNAPNWAYYVVPVAEANSQRNGEETWFRVQ